MKLSEVEVSDLVGLIVAGMVSLLFWKMILAPMTA